jgi:hypothetical protein
MFQYMTLVALWCGPTGALPIFDYKLIQTCRESLVSCVASNYTDDKKASIVQTCFANQKLPIVP